MDVDELSTVLHMQNQTQKLLLQLQNQQVKSRNMMDTNKSVKPKSYRSSENHSRDTQTAKSGYSSTQLKVKRINDALAVGSKREFYRKVSPERDRPGRKNGFRLAQGIAEPDKENIFSSTDDFTQNIEEHGDLNTSVTFQDEVIPTSQPLRATVATHTDVPTYKSILKRRKIIDDNIKVKSQYSHTPNSSFTDKEYNPLNYSYSEVDEGEFDPIASTQNERTDTRPIHGTESSIIDRATKPDSLQSTGITTAREASQEKTVQSDIHDLVRERLLLDSGNDRRNANLVLDLSHRPKSFLFERVGEKTGECQQALEPYSKQNDRGSQLPAGTKHNLKAAKSPKSPGGNVSRGKLWQSRDEPLLGYDWIAGNLDNETSLFSQPDDYFQEINKFRSSNKEVCIGDDMLRNKLDLTRPISPEIQDPAHQCLHGFTVNERLFTEPLNPDEEGRSICPVCLISRPKPAPDAPGFVRVSIPRSTLEQPYKVKPHRRRSFDATDTYALSKHCLAGYECSVPTMIPTAKNIDLKGTSSSRGIETMSLQEAENFVKLHSRTSRMLSSTLRYDSTTERSGATESFTSRLNNTTHSLNKSVEPLSRKRTTTELLNTSHGLRYDLQDMARRNGTETHRAPHSTEYPTL